MNAQSIISHRMFVAALNHDQNEATRKRAGHPEPAAGSVRRQRAKSEPELPRAIPGQMLLLSDAIQLPASSA